MNRLAKALPLLLLALGAGCMLISGQITIVQKFDDDTDVSDQKIYALSVDLNENSDYKDHKDKIKSLEAIGFVVKVWNHGNLEGKGQGYLSLVPIDILGMEPEDIADHPDTYLILDIKDPIPPGGFRDITFEDSQKYITNFDMIEEAIKEGSIYFFGITDIGQIVEWEDLKLIATVNFGL
ncbi:MAG: hypothetical protein ABIK65_00180 [Candidatus Eisenbacteria bacterium]